MNAKQDLYHVTVELSGPNRLVHYVILTHLPPYHIRLMYKDEYYGRGYVDATITPLKPNFSHYICEERN